MFNPSLRWLAPALLVSITTIATPLPLKAQSLYNPIPLAGSGEIKDTLSEQDIPTGQGGFARDYLVQLSAGDQVAIDVSSESFDPTVVLISRKGAVIGENDDASNPEPTTNSLLFTRITTTGSYIIRVKSFSEATGGDFTLKLTRLKPI